MKNLTKTILLAASLGVGAVGLSVIGNSVKAEARKLYNEKNNQAAIKVADELTTYGDILHALSLFIPPITAPLIIYRHNKNQKEDKKLNLPAGYNPSWR